MSFVPLNVTSSYTLLSSTLHVETIVNYVKDNRSSAIALTDKNVLYGAEKFYNLARQENIKPILGLTLDIQFPKDGSQIYPLTLLAKDKTEIIFQ